MDVFTLRDQVLDDHQGDMRSFLTVRDDKIAALIERELREGQQAEVARVASLIFGAAVRPPCVIGEHLRRRTAPVDIDSSSPPLVSTKKPGLP